MSTPHTQVQPEPPSQPAPCGLCNATASQLIFVKRGWRLVQCRGCGLVRVDPLPGVQQVANWYTPVSGYQLHRLGGPNRYSRWEARRSAQLARCIGQAPQPGATLLDIGCGAGDFMRHAQALGWQTRGLELGKHLATFARLKRGLDVEHGRAEAALERFGPDTFDAITLWDVVEHLLKPAAVLRDLVRVLKPGGKLYLATPNLTGWVPRFHYALLRPLTHQWPHPEPPLHLYQFSRGTVRRLLNAAGLVRVQVAHDEIPLWYTSGFRGEPGRREWLHGEPGVLQARSCYWLTAPIFLAARLAKQGDSLIAVGVRITES